MMRRVILILLKARDAANFAELPPQLARAGQEATARSVLLPCNNSQQKLIRAPNVDSRTLPQAVLTGGAALVTDLLFSIGMSQSRCTAFQARRSAAGNEYPGPSCADDAPSDTDSTQNARCCAIFQAMHSAAGNEYPVPAARMMRRVILILLKARDAAHLAELRLHHARAVQEAAARRVLLPCP